MRTEGDFIRINEWLLPLSWLYGLGVNFRNKLFDIGVLKSKAYDIPVISVGNITVGGSGKTPHVEYLVRLLGKTCKVGVLSRGYKRKSKGFQLAHDDTPMPVIGDEPYQMRHKFKDIYVAVDKDRREGIERLTNDEETKDVDVILLDDAFQHRYVKPGINILLVDYHRLIIYDKLLPAGRLREPQSGKDRADIVIITKCPKDLKPMEFRVLVKAINLYPYQDLYFTTLDYDDLVNPYTRETQPKEAMSEDNVLLVTGIASPKQMLLDLENHCKSITPLTYGDHHQFTDEDIENINNTFASLPKPSRIITTEKDVARLTVSSGLSEEAKRHLYVLPVHIRFMNGQEESFNNKIISYVRKNSRNSILAKGKNDNKSRDSHNTGNGPRTISFRDN